MSWEEKIIEGLSEKAKADSVVATVGMINEVRKSGKKTRSISVIALFISIIALLIQILK